MIIVKKRNLYAFIIIASLVFLVYAYFSYTVISKLYSADQERIKVISEKVFFWGIAAFSVLIFFGLRIVLKSINFNKSLDKLLIMSESRGVSPVEGLKKLGDTGKKLSEIYHSLDSLSEKKSLKIASLNHLINMIFTFIEKKVMVLSVTGEIIYISESLNKKDVNTGSLRKGQITDFFPDFSISAEIDYLVSNRTMKEIESINGYLYPVFNLQNELDYLVLFLDQHVTLNIFPVSKEIINSIKKKNGRFTNVRKKLPGIFKKNK